MKRFSIALCIVHSALSMAPSSVAQAAGNGAFGICEHLAMPASYAPGGEYTNRVALLNYCAAAGIGMVRTDFRWPLCWSSGNSDWSWTSTDLSLIHI